MVFIASGLLTFALSCIVRYPLECAWNLLIDQVNQLTDVITIYPMTPEEEEIWGVNYAKQLQDTVFTLLQFGASFIGGLAGVLKFSGRIFKPSSCGL